MEWLTEFDGFIHCQSGSSERETNEKMVGVFLTGKWFTHSNNCSRKWRQFSTHILKTIERNMNIISSSQCHWMHAFICIEYKFQFAKSSHWLFESDVIISKCKSKTNSDSTILFRLKSMTNWQSMPEIRSIFSNHWNMK